MTWQPNRQKFLNGGYAIPLGNNISLLMGNSHEQGGITGITPKDDIEAEGGEVIQKTKDSKGGNVLRIFSKYPMFGDYSPSELVQAGANPNEVFKQQEQYKDRLGLNDDGTPKQRAKYGDRIEYELGGNKKNQQQEEEQPFVVPGTGLNLETTEDYKKQQLQQFSETTGLPLEYLEELFEDDDFTAESLANFENETNADNSKIPVNNDYEDAGLFDLFPQQKQEIPVQTPIKNNVEDNTENDEENVSENEEQQRKLYQFKAFENEDEDNNFVNPSLQQNEDDYYTPYDDEYLDASDLDKPVYSVNDVNPSVLPTRKEKEYKEHSETDIANVLNNKSTRAVTDEIWNTLNESDLTYAQKIAIMANWYQESTWRPDVKTGDHGHSYGLAQFNDSGELGQLKNYAKENNLDISKASTQTKFAIKRTKDKGGLKRTRGTQGFEDITEKQAFEMWNSEDPEKATIAYMLLYERPSWAASGNRINAAKVLQRVYPDSTAVSKKLGGEFKLGGLSRSKDYGSKKKPYPSVNKKDFAGGHRSYPIPTKADATDALRLAGLHHRSDVKAKIYKKYPSLRKKAELGLKENDESQEQLRNDILNGDIDLNNGISSVNYGFTSPHKFINTADPTAIQLYPTYNNGLTRYVTDEGHPIGFKYDSQKDGYYIYDQVTNQGGEGVLPEVEVNPNKMVYDPLVDASHKVSPMVQREFYKEHPEARQEFLNRLQGPPKEKGLKEVYPEFDLLLGGRGLTTGAVQSVLKSATPYVRSGLELLNPSTYIDPIAKGLGAKTYNILGAKTLAGAAGNTAMLSSIGSEAVNYLMGDDKSLIGDFNAALSVFPVLGGSSEKLYQFYNFAKGNKLLKNLNSNIRKFNKWRNAEERINHAISSVQILDEIHGNRVDEMERYMTKLNDNLRKFKKLYEGTDINLTTGDLLGKTKEDISKLIKGFDKIGIPINPINIQKAKWVDFKKYLTKHASIKGHLIDDIKNNVYEEYNGFVSQIFNEYKRKPSISSGKIELPYFSKNNIGKNPKDIEKITYNIKSPHEKKSYRIVYNTNETINMNEKSSSYNQVELDSYFEHLKKNIEYTERALNGKVFGSSAVVAYAHLPHNTHDIDIITTAERAKKKFGNINKLPYKNGSPNSFGTREIDLDGGIYGDAGKIDYNIIEEGSDGKATGKLAKELYRQFFPQKYNKAVLESQLSGNPIKIDVTPEELYQAYDPVTKTVMDALEIDYTQYLKEKHIGRIFDMIEFAEPKSILKGIRQFGIMTMGTNYKQLPKLDFSNIENNKVLLSKLKLPFEESIVKNPERMQAMLELWYNDKTLVYRGVNSSNKDVLFQSFNRWIDRGGHAMGVGLNTTTGGASGYGPNIGIRQIPINFGNTTNPNEIVNKIIRSTGQHDYAFTSEDVATDIGKYAKQGDTISKLLRHLTRLYDTRQMTLDDVNRYFSVLRKNGIYGLHSGSQYSGGDYMSSVNYMPSTIQHHYSLNIRSLNDRIRNIDNKVSNDSPIYDRRLLNSRKTGFYLGENVLTLPKGIKPYKIIDNPNKRIKMKKTYQKMVDRYIREIKKAQNKRNMSMDRGYNLASLDIDLNHKLNKVYKNKAKLIKVYTAAMAAGTAGLSIYGANKFINYMDVNRKINKIASEKFSKEHPFEGDHLVGKKRRSYIEERSKQYKLYKKTHKKEIENELSKLEENSKVVTNKNK